ncbi:MAG: hypothetical protein ABH833_04350 [Parcubacteria group bacterium]
MNYEQTWLEYDTDIKAYDHKNEELKEILNDREFFIFSEGVPTCFNDLKFNLERNNTILRCCGSMSRDYVADYRKWWSTHLPAVSGGGFDPTIHPYLGFVSYHIPNIYEFSDFPGVAKKLPIKVCHAPTNTKKKSTTKINEILDKLQKEFDFKKVVYNRKPWKESLKIKASCHITIDQLKIGAYASSSIESMYMGHAVVSKISPFIRSVHPDIPIVHATEEILEDVLRDLLSDNDRIKSIGKKSHEYAVKEHSAKNNVVKWDYLIRWVNEGFK